MSPLYQRAARVERKGKWKSEVLSPVEHFHFNIKSIKPRKGRLVLSDLRAYQQRTRERDLRFRQPLEITIDYVKREYDFTEAQAEVGYHTVWLNGYPGLPEELFADVDRMARTKDGAYRMHGGHAPRLGSFMTGSIPYGVTLEQAKEAVDVFFVGLGKEFGVASEGVIHIKKERPDHFHAVVTDRMVSAAGVGAKQRRFNAISQKAVGVGVVSGDRLLCEATVFMRDTWAQLMSKASGREISAQSFADQGLGIEPVKYVLRRDIMDQERNGRQDWRLERDGELAAREQSLAARSKLLEPKRQAVCRRRSKAALRAAIGRENSSPKIVLPMRSVTDRLAAMAAKQVDDASRGVADVAMPSPTAAGISMPELASLPIPSAQPSIESALPRHAKSARLRRRKAALLAHISAEAPPFASAEALESSLLGRLTIKPFRPQASQDHRELLTLFTKIASAEVGQRTVERDPFTAPNTAVHHDIAYRNHLNERRKRWRRKAMKAAEAADCLARERDAVARLAAKDGECRDRLAPVDVTLLGVGSIVVKPSLTESVREDKGLKELSGVGQMKAVGRSLPWSARKRRWARASTAVTQSILAEMPGYQSSVRDFPACELAHEHMVHAKARSPGLSSSEADLLKSGGEVVPDGPEVASRAADLPPTEMVERKAIDSRRVQEPSTSIDKPPDTPIAYDDNAGAVPNTKGIEEAPIYQSLRATLSSRVLSLAARLARDLRSLGLAYAPSLKRKVEPPPKGPLPRAKQIDAEETLRPEPQAVPTSAAATQGQHARTKPSGPSAVDLASRYAVAVMRSGPLSVDAKNALAKAVGLNLSQFDDEIRWQAATCRSTDPKPSVEKRRVAELANMLDYGGLRRAIELVELANEARVSSGVRAVERSKKNHIDSTRPSKNLLDE